MQDEEIKLLIELMKDNSEKMGALIVLLTDAKVPVPDVFPYFSSHETLNHLNINKRTLARRRKDKTLVPYIMKGKYCYLKTDVINASKKKEQEAPEEVAE